jgi:hypothetical protein
MTSEEDMLNRIETCLDVDVLDLCADEIRDFPEDAKARLTEAYHKRREDLMGA